MTQEGLLFPAGFGWGTATSSHQVEGNLTNNDWWLAEQTGGYIYQNQTSGRACDWWNRAEEDFDRMAGMSQNTHRLSIEWSRIEPRPGVWDHDALDRYHQMIVGLRQRGIQPMVTLHHFTNPLWMAEQGGWENALAVRWFERYVRKVVSTLGDQVTLWCTLNEPNVMITQGYVIGRWPPGKRDLSMAVRVTGNVVRAHAAAYHAIHELQPSAQVGLAQHIMKWQPRRPWLFFDWIATDLMAHIFHHILLGSLTEGVMRVPGMRPSRVAEASRTLDWLGVNYYQRYRVHFSPRSIQTLFMELGTKPGEFKGPGGWGEIHPQGLSDTLTMLWQRYRLPMVITENGIPDEHDEHRPQFIVTHLHQLWQAIQREVPVLGYYFWSLLDNFEWTEGYDPRFRFGLIGVDFETQERRIRQSGHLYADICRQGGLSRESVEQFTPELLPDLFGA